MSDNKTIRIIGDSPEENSDLIAFGFDAYARTIAQVIAGKDNPTIELPHPYWGKSRRAPLRRRPGRSGHYDRLKRLDPSRYRERSA